MSEELEVLKQVAARLEAAGIPYMLTGSLALNYYATPRMTRDIDLVVEVSAADVDRITDLFSGEFYVDRQAVQEAIDARGIFNVIHSTKVIKIDLVVRKDSEYRRLEFSRRRRVSVEGQELSIVTPEDLVLSARRAALLRRSGEERLKMGCSMHATARALVVASIVAQDPNASPAVIRQALFLRFYGEDFDPDTRARIVAALG